MKIILLRPSPEVITSPLSKYNPELLDVDRMKRNVGVVKPIPVEQLVTLRLFSNNAQVQTTYEKFIGRKIKMA